MSIDLKKINKIHFTGIGGIGMSALARMFLDQNKKVSGSDKVLTDLTDRLSKEGAKIFPEESSRNIDDKLETLIYSPAIPDDHTEVVMARKKKIPTLSYPETLGLISRDYFTIAVSGTHGKTTTTAMISHILKKCGYDPTVIVGSLLKGESEGSNYVSGKSGYFVVEACEYKRSFLHLRPEVLVVTNIAEDHLDYYKDLNDIQNAFSELVSFLPEDGALVVPINDDNIKPILGRSKSKIIDSRPICLKKGELPIFGEHNRKNAESAIAVAVFLGIEEKKAKGSFVDFCGTWRRFEYKGKTEKGSLVYDDYAHHPDEISATISLAKERFPDKKITVVFQPHLHSRTDFFFNDFVESLSQADKIFLMPIYEAREERVKKIYTSNDLAKNIAQKNKEVVFVDSFQRVVSEVSKECNSRDVIIMMGAGDIYKVTKKMILK